MIASVRIDGRLSSTSGLADQVDEEWKRDTVTRIKYMNLLLNLQFNKAFLNIFVLLSGYRAGVRPQYSSHFQRSDIFII